MIMTIYPQTLCRLAAARALQVARAEIQQREADTFQHRADDSLALCEFRNGSTVFIVLPVKRLAAWSKIRGNNEPDACQIEVEETQAIIRRGSASVRVFAQSLSADVVDTALRIVDTDDGEFVADVGEPEKELADAKHKLAQLREITRDDKKLAKLLKVARDSKRALKAAAQSYQHARALLAEKSYKAALRDARKIRKAQRMFRRMRAALLVFKADGLDGALRYPVWLNAPMGLREHVVRLSEKRDAMPEKHWRKRAAVSDAIYNALGRYAARRVAKLLPAGNMAGVSWADANPDRQGGLGFFMWGWKADSYGVARGTVRRWRVLRAKLAAAHKINVADFRREREKVLARRARMDDAA